VKSIIKYISLFTLSVVALAVVSLFVPPVTEVIVEKALSYFLKVDAVVSRAKLSYAGFYAIGRLDHNDSFVLSIKPHGFSEAKATLHYDGNVHTFSNVATVELPRIDAIVNATFATESQRLDLNASVLDGTFKGNLSLEEMAYAYTITDLNVSRYQQRQTHHWYTQPVYASGLLSAQGGGIIESPYTVGFTLQSRNLQLEENTTALLFPHHKGPLPLNLGINGSVNTDALFTDISLSSALISLQAKPIHFDFNASSFDLDLALVNHDKQIAPIDHAALELNATITKDTLDALFTLLVDDYRLDGKQMRYNIEAGTLDLVYRITSLTKKPLYLQDDHAIFGDLNYRDGALSVSAGSKALKGPVSGILKEKKLVVISNNINLEALQKMLNLDVVVRGSAAIKAEADLDSDPLQWNADFSSDNLALPQKYRKDIGLKNDLQVTLTAKNDPKDDIRLIPMLKSDIGTIDESALLYVRASQRLFFNINAKRLSLPGYRASHLNLRGAYRLKTGTLEKTRLTTPYEKIIIKNAEIADKSITADVDLHINRLDRFGDLNRDYKLSAESKLSYTPKKSHLTLDSRQLGTLSVTYTDPLFKVSGKGLDVEDLMRLTGQPLTLQGDLGYTLQYSPSMIKATITAEQIRGQGPLEHSIRPFALNAGTTLRHKGNNRFSGDISVTTGNERADIAGLVADIAKKEVKANYVIDVNDLEKSSYILPSELKGPLHLDGVFEQKGRQYLTLNLTGFRMPEAWHRKLDKNATSTLETNASLEVQNDSGLLHLNGDLQNSLLRLDLHESSFDTGSGVFALDSSLKTDLWLKDSDITASGNYKAERIFIANATIDTQQETIHINDLYYSDQNLSTGYRATLKEYPGAPYSGSAEVHGRIATQPVLDATLESNSLGGDLKATLTEQELYVKARDVAVYKLIAFSGKKLPITQGRLNADVSISADSLRRGNRSTLQGSTDINITDMMIENLALDDSLKTLRESQDLSFFQGSLTELPIVRSIADIPTKLREDNTKRTHIREMRLSTSIDHAMLSCRDCAMSTDANLIAAQGDINLSSKQFGTFYVGLLHPTNCAYYVQRVKGDLKRPEVELARTGFKLVSGAAISLISNVGSVVDLGADIVKKSGAIVGDIAGYVPLVGKTTEKTITRVTDKPKDVTARATECTPFYSGTVKHPKPLKN